MKFYTKEWDSLMGATDLTSGLKPVADKVYTDEEIKAFYDADLAEEIDRERRLHELFESDGSGLGLLMGFGKGSMGAFDPKETAASFKRSYDGLLKCAAENYPSWVSDSVDMRLVALWRMPKSAFDRLETEERENKARFEKINREAEAVLSAQGVPEELLEKFCFHDGAVIKIQKQGKDLALFVRRDGDWPGDDTPYSEILFSNAKIIEKEKGITVRCNRDFEGYVSSGCRYLYDELYRTEEGYELHMMLAMGTNLKYFTVACTDITVENGVSFE